MQNQPLPQLPDVMDLFMQTKKTLRRRWRLFAMILVIPAVVQALTELTARLENLSSGTHLVVLIVSVLIGFWGSAALILVLGNEKVKDFQQAYFQVIPSLFSFVWVTLIVALIVIIGLLLLIAPGLYLSIIFLFYTFFIVLGGERGWGAVEKSRVLVKDYWWPVFGRLIGLLLMLLILSIFTGIFSAIFDYIIITTALLLLLDMVIVALTTTYLYHIYMSLKTIKKANIS